MEGIEHRSLAVNGIKMHIAEKGSGPLVLMLHGFPELWYSWRHQIAGLASHGYHAVAPDLRGYGGTDSPPSPQSYTLFHLVGDLIALLDALGQDQAFVVGHDWGAAIAWYLCLFRPDRVKALVNLSVEFFPRYPLCKPIEALRSRFGDDYYMCRFQEPGAAESDFARFDTATVIKKILTFRSPHLMVAPKGKGIMDYFLDQPIVSDFLTEEDVQYYADNFEKTGFTGGFNYYRALDLDWELTAAWGDVKVKVPVKFIVGDQDITYNTPGAKDYIHNGAFKENVPLLEDIVVMEGAGHFINQEKPHEITSHILEFITKF